MMAVGGGHREHTRKRKTVTPPAGIPHGRHDQQQPFTKKTRSRHRHQDRQPTEKTTRLFDRTIYALDEGKLADGLLLAREKADAVTRWLTPEERALADDGRGALLVIQDEGGQRYIVLLRRRCPGGTHMFCGRGWTDLAAKHQLQRGDVLRFQCDRGVLREGTGKLYLGVRVVKAAPAGGKVVVVGPRGRGAGEDNKCWPPWPTATAVQDHRTTAGRAPWVAEEEEKKKAQEMLVRGIPTAWFFCTRKTSSARPCT